MLNTKDSASVLVVVFLLVLAISMSIYYIMKKIKEKKEDEKTYIKPIVKEKPLPEKVKKIAIEKIDTEDDDISDELLSVLTAAIAAIRSSEDKPFIIRHVTKRRRRAVWNAAGIKNNIKPF